MTPIDPQGLFGLFACLTVVSAEITLIFFLLSKVFEGLLE